MKKVTIITDTAGKVVGSRLGHGYITDPRSGISTKLVAGPGQTVHEIEIEVPARLTNSQEIAAFHDRIQEHLSST